MNPEKIGSHCLILITCLLLSACNTPSLTSFDSNSAPEHSIVEISGKRLLGAKIIWDADLPTEKVVAGNYLGAHFFSVPPGSSLGNHPVALENISGRSNKLNFTVTKALPFGNPRVDHITLMAKPTFDGAGNVKALLYVQGPNIDTGAIVRVNNVEVATVAHKVMLNDLKGVNPLNLGYPIYHYTSFVVEPAYLIAGSTITVEVENMDGNKSSKVNYVLPTDLASVDSDGDGFPDVMEINGYDGNNDGITDVKFWALEADPYRRDVFLEIDVMQGLVNPPIADTATQPGTFSLVKQMFANAPIINPYHDNGIHLIIDSSGTVPTRQVVDFEVKDNALTGTANFNTLKATYFNSTKRGGIYHYGIWAIAKSDGSSGISDLDYKNNEGGDDLIVSFDGFSSSYQTLRSQVETLAHEFGHNLGQWHGGDNHSKYKPNYLSVMSYTWQLRSGTTAAWRLKTPTCAPFYYAQTGVTEANGAMPTNVNSIVDFSEGMAASITENNFTLNETTGVCGQAVDWNDNGNLVETNFNSDVDDNDDATETVNDYSNWANLNFSGPATTGTN